MTVETEPETEPSGPVEYVTREEFFAECWDYEAGEHVTVLGPTGSGKTFLTQELIDHTAVPELPAVVLVMKPRDATVTRWNKTAKFTVVRNWPPGVSPWKPKKPRGWILQPRHSFDPDRDEEQHRIIFRRAILDSYRKGNRILFADELFSLCKELGLEKELVTIWSKGRSMGCGLWGGTQKPTHVPLWAYSMAEHLFLANDPDKRARDRFGEIGGVDPKLVERVVLSLEKYEWLYIRRRDRTMCILRP